MFFNPVKTEIAPRRFLEALHHRALSTGRGLIYLQQETRGVSNCSARSLDEALAFVDAKKRDIYACVNTMRRQGSRSTQNCYAVTGFYVDLDKHDGTEDEIREAKRRTQELLEQQFVSGKLPMPTLITHTRRGLGLFYVLNNTIANTTGAESLLTLHKYTYKRIFKAFESVLDGEGYLTVDKSVMDKPRVCRVPGTTVGDTGFVVGLSDYEPRFYSMQEIRDGFGIKDRTGTEDRLLLYSRLLGRVFRRPHKTIQINSASTVSFLEHRLLVLQNIAELLAERGEFDGYREQLLFCSYIYLKQLLPYEDACAELRRLNRDLFGGAIGDGEIKNIIRSVAKKTYRMKNDYLMELFDLSPAEASAVGIGSVNKQSQRAAAKERTQTRRQFQVALVKQYKPQIKRREELLDTINARLTKEGYKAISMHTLDRRIKEAGLNKDGTLSYSETAEYKQQLFNSAKKSTEKEKLPKIAPVSISPSRGTPEEVSRPQAKRGEASDAVDTSWDPETADTLRRYEFVVSLRAHRLSGWDDGLLGLYETLGGEAYGEAPYTGGIVLRRSVDAGRLTETEAASVRRFVRQLYRAYRGRAYALLQRMAKALSEDGTVSYAELDAVVRRFYPYTLSQVTILQWSPSKKQKAAFEALLRNRRLWDWVLVDAKSAPERFVASVYHTVNNRCRNALKENRGDDASGYGGLSFRDLKRKVLYSLAFEDLQRIAAKLTVQNEASVVMAFIDTWRAASAA